MPNNRSKGRMADGARDLLNKEHLIQSHEELPSGKAAGIDGETKEQYNWDLENRIEGLVNRMKKQAYKPQPSRRTYIRKDKDSLRPLGIPSYEDKIVQRTMGKILNAIYEQKFMDFSYGFRPERNQHQALKKLDEMAMDSKYRYIVDADIKGFFDHVNHEWMIKFLEHDIADPNFIRLIQRFLKAGIMEEAKFINTEEGTPQGGVISPTLANVYLHYVLDIWFENYVKRKCKGKAEIVRFADDFVCCFETKEDAGLFYNLLIDRLAKFNLRIAEDKTQIIRFGRGSEHECQDEGRKKPGTFDFLGFRHYWGKGKNGTFRVKRKTSPKKFKMKVKEFKSWIRYNRHMNEKDLVDKIKRKLNGHYQYYGVSDNYKSIYAYYKLVLDLTRKWRNRRSQKTSFTIEKFNMFLERNMLPKPKIKVNLFKKQLR